ncbi:alpha/beta hydrolase [Actinocorallia longicatena]|uniref:Alpha/beta hydrolase n=1 Tax=Actinocorallia longicatena TaxID=111803 RepID=A0ABP6Q2E9_9ACTN
MRRSALVVAGSATGLLMLATALSSASAAPSPTPNPDFRIPRQTLNWKPCPLPANTPQEYKALECAKLYTPLDWHKKNGKKISLQITRLKARSGNPKGVVFTNPGGPGGPGWSLPLAFLDAGRNKLLDNMDVIGIDVRGTGYSTQAACKSTNWGNNLDPRNRSKANTKKLLAAAKRVAAACNNKGSAKKIPARLVNTPQTVYDLEWLRINLKDSKGAGVNRINWVGYSGGSWMGAYYARYWPKHTGRFVLDSNTDFTSTWQRIFAAQPKAFQTRFYNDFGGWAAKYNGIFKLGASKKAVYTRYERVRKAITKAKGGYATLVFDDGSKLKVYASTLDNIISSSLYVKGQFIDIASILFTLSQAAKNAGFPIRQQTTLAVHNVANPLADPEAGSNATFYDVTCNDTKYVKAGQLASYTAKNGKKYPLVGYGKIFDPCAFWKRPSGVNLKKMKSGPKLLMIQSTHDPATAYSGAVNAHKKYKNSRLITVVNEGDHGIYASGNGCVDNIVEAYLVDGVYPGKDGTCQGQPIPAPDLAGRLQAPVTNILIRNKGYGDLLEQ